jgi:ketosteroid isomerase-like protein
MAKLWYAVALISLLAPAEVRAGPAEDANAIVANWAASYSANDIDALLGLYSADAILLGTTSPIIADTAESRRAYFARLPGTGNKSVIGDHRTMVASDTVVLVTGFYDFTIVRDGKPTESPSRFSMLVVNQGDGWRIAHHHSSPRPKPPQ